MGDVPVKNVTNLRFPGAEVGAGGLDTNAEANGVIWRPGIASIGNIVETWAEVKTAITATNGALTVYVDSSIAPCVVDPGVTNCFGRTFFRAAQTIIAPAPDMMTLPDDAVLLDPAGFIFDLLVILQGTSTPNLAQSKTVSIGVLGGAAIDNQGTQPAIRVQPGQFGVIMSFVLGAQFKPTSGPLIELTQAGQGGFIVSFTGGQFNGNDVVRGPVGSQCVIVYDAGINQFPTNPGFFGVTQHNPLDQALFMNYIPANLANWSGVQPTSVADALDRIAAKIAPIP